MTSSLVSQDIKELYERKLEKVNNLYMELSAWKLKLEESERVLARRERALSIQGSKVHYKKKLPKLGGSAAAPSGADRFRRGSSAGAGAGGVFSVQTTAHYRTRNTSPSTPEVLSTSPETPFKLPQPEAAASILAAASDDLAAAVVRVRDNPGYAPQNSPERLFGASGVDWSRVHRVTSARGGGGGTAVTRGATAPNIMHYLSFDSEAGGGGTPSPTTTFNANNVEFWRVRELWERACS